MPNVTRKQLAERIAQSTGLTQVDTAVVIEALLQAVGNTMSEGKNIELRGFGSFKIKQRKARNARNPRTGETIHIDEGVKLVFQASRQLKERVDRNASGNPVSADQKDQEPQEPTPPPLPAARSIVAPAAGRQIRA